MISIIAPAYNEEAVIKEFVEQVVDITRFVFKNDDWELIVVNDGSTDKTRDILHKLNTIYPLVVIDHAKNYGLGKALESGFKTAKGDIVVTMDADGSHNPILIPTLCKEVVSTGCDIAIASRYMKDVPLWRQTGNATMRTWPAKKSGYRAYRASILKELSDLPSGFEVQTAILTQLKNARIQEVSFKFA